MWVAGLLMTLSFITGMNRAKQALHHKKSHYINYYDLKKNNVFIIEITDHLRSTGSYNRYYGRVVSIKDREASGKILIRSKIKDSIQLKLGSFYKTKAHLNSIKSFKNIGGFDYKKYLENIGIIHEINSSDFILTKYKSSTRSWLLKSKQETLKKIETSSFKKETKRLIAALVLGERSEIDSVWIENYAKAGIIHVLAISGLQMGLLMLLFAWFFKPLRFLPQGNYLQALAIILCLWLYAFFTGGSASVIRAATMFSLFSLGKYINRSPPNTFLLLLSFGVLIFINPLYLKQLGFIMSYTAVFGILLLQPILMKMLPLKNKYLKKIWNMTTVTLAAQIAISPITIYYFNQFPGLFLITNWVVLPFVALYLYIGIFSVLLIHLKPLPSLVIDFLDLMTSSLNNFVLWIIEQEKFLIENIRINIYEVVLIYTLIFLCYSSYKKNNKNVKILLLIALLFFYKGHEQRENLNKKSSVWLVSSFKNTILFQKKENELIVISREKIKPTNRLIQDYKNKYRLDHISFETLQNSYTIGKKNVVFANDLWAEQLSVKNKKIILVLTDNTKINLEVVLKNNLVKQVILDGSNFPYLKNRWIKTCKKLKIPFYDLQTKGPFLFTSESGDIAF